MVFLLAAALFFCSPALSAQSAVPLAQAAALSAGNALPGEDPALLLGMDLKQAVERFGLPESLYSARGAEPWQDDVVFQYPGGFSLFWYSGRVWQVRLGSAYAGPAYGVFIGDAPDKIVSLLGQPFLSAEGSYLFNLPGRNYPIRMRAYVKDGKIADLYVYRADF
jgi:hypothetical protein